MYLIQDLRLESDSIKKVVLNAQKGWNEEYTRLGMILIVIFSFCPLILQKL